MNLLSGLVPARNRPPAGTPTDGIPTGVDLEFIQNQAALPEDSSAQEVESYHRALFLAHHAAELERLEQQAHIHSDRVERLEGRLVDVRGRLDGVETLLPRPGVADGELDAPTPWTVWDRMMFGLAGLGVVGLLVFGVLNISFNLLESGLITFQENPIRAYFWAALLPVGAMAVKVGWDSLEGQRARHAYLWACLGLGVAGVLLWVGAYAMVYPSLSKNTAERIESLTVFDTPGTRGGGMNAAGTKWVDMGIVAAQAVSELFLSAALGIYMTRLAGRHAVRRLAGNPLFDQLVEEQSGLERELSSERLALGEARGNQNRLDHRLTALVAFARSTFHKEVALRRDQSRQERLLLDQIAGQLRTQLQTVGEGARLRREPVQPSVVIGNGHEH